MILMLLAAVATTAVAVIGGGVGNGGGVFGLQLSSGRAACAGVIVYAPMLCLYIPPICSLYRLICLFIYSSTVNPKGP